MYDPDNIAAGLQFDPDKIYAKREDIKRKVEELALQFQQGQGGGGAEEEGSPLVKAEADADVGVKTEAEVKTEVEAEERAAAEGAAPFHAAAAPVRETPEPSLSPLRAAAACDGHVDSGPDSPFGAAADYTASPPSVMGLLPALPSDSKGDSPPIVRGALPWLGLAQGDPPAVLAVAKSQPIEID